MSTGFTAIIEEGIDGREATFKDYVWRCAQMFRPYGAFWDSIPTDKPPTRIEVQSRYAEAVREAKEAYEAARSMSVKDAEALLEETYERTLAQVERSNEEINKKLAAYEAMAAKVRAWVPPTPEHKDLQDYMLSQIDDSTRYVAPLNLPKRETAVEYLAERLDWYKRRLDQAVASEEKHRKGVAGANEWIAALVESVGAP